MPSDLATSPSGINRIATSTQHGDPGGRRERVSCDYHGIARDGRALVCRHHFRGTFPASVCTTPKSSSAAATSFQ